MTSHGGLKSSTAVPAGTPDVWSRFLRLPERGEPLPGQAAIGLRNDGLSLDAKISWIP